MRTHRQTLLRPPQLDGLGLEANLREAMLRVSLGAAFILFIFSAAHALHAFGPRPPWITLFDTLANLTAGLFALGTAAFVRRGQHDLATLQRAGVALVVALAVCIVGNSVVASNIGSLVFVGYVILGLGVLGIDPGLTFSLIGVLFVAGIAASAAIGPFKPMMFTDIQLMASVLISLAVYAGRMAGLHLLRDLFAKDQQHRVELKRALERAEHELGERKVAQAQRDQAEAERADLAGRLLQTQKLEAIGTLAGGVAHDMNNVLAAIIGLAEVGITEHEPGSPAHQDLVRIVAAAQQGATLTRDLLGFARRGKRRNEHITVNGFVESALAKLRRAAPRNVSVGAGLSPQTGSVVGDPEQLAQTVVNLGLNAIEAMPEGGELCVCTSLEQVSGSAAGLRSGSYAVVEVTDGGVGMTAETMARAFDPFFSTKPASSSRGLGLSMVYGTVRDHDGEVTLRSAPGQGTTVRLRLPSAAAPAPRRASLSTTPAAQGRPVLVVDDEEMVRAAVTRMLRASGRPVVGVGSGAEAVAAVEKDPSAFGAVILDLVMPGMDGSECFGHLHRLAPELPVIIVSGYPRDQRIDALIQSGAMSFLNKPFARAELLEHVARAATPQPGGQG